MTRLLVLISQAASRFTDSPQGGVLLTSVAVIILTLPACPALFQSACGNLLESYLWAALPGEAGAEGSGQDG